MTARWGRRFRSFDRLFAGGTPTSPNHRSDLWISLSLGGAEPGSVGQKVCEFELWEHHGGRLTVGVLRQVLGRVDDDLLIVVAFHGGERILDLDPMELGPTGSGARTDRLMLTVVEHR